MESSVKFYVGYQLRPDDRFVKKILQHRDRVAEVYFSWPGVPNGRGVVRAHDVPLPWEALEAQRAELRQLHAAGIGMNLLLNGNCYGARSLARSFYQETGDLVSALQEDVGLGSVTTTSPVIAKFIKNNFPEVQVRASVNMEIGTREGVEYLAEWFDGFYVQRELNRKFARAQAFSEFCHSIGRQVYLLANSGCLNHCSARQFHDNLVSHETEIAQMDNAFVFNGVCRDFLQDEGHRERILEISNWIRPEDIDRYAGVVDGVKLATRVSSHPELILDAYANGRFSGNVLTLMEPDFSGVFAPTMLNAAEFPADYWQTLSDCAGNCAECGYCRALYRENAESMV